VSVVLPSLPAPHRDQPPLWALIMYLMASFFGIGLLLGNLNGLAMQPLGHIAGTGAAVVCATSMLISLTLGTWIGSQLQRNRRAAGRGVRGDERVRHPHLAGRSRKRRE
jgi:hypothetical protein